MSDQPTGPLHSSTAEQAWALLSWAESACTWVVRDRDRSLASEVALALAMLDNEVLNLRDVQVVANLLHDACDRAGFSYERVIRAGLSQQPQVAERTRAWLLASPPALGWNEVHGQGKQFTYARRPHTIDTDALMTRLGRKPTP